ncbi:MAG: diacylglycerol kinase family protein [Byssovorax sp.]
MRLDVIVNTRARRVLARPSILGEVTARVRGHGEVFPTGDLGALTEAARAIAARGSDLVVLAGGDGSFMAGVTALAHAFGDRPLPRIALLPGGTVATVARNFGVRGELVPLLGRLIDARHALVTRRRPTLRALATTGSAREERIGFIFGTGLVAKFFEVYYEAGAQGYAGAAKIVARVFAESFYGGAYARRVLDPLPCSIEVDGRLLAPRSFSLVCCAVVRDLGIHMLVNHRAAEDPLRPHLVASPLPAHSLGPRAPLVLAGRSIGGPGHFDDLVSVFTVRFPRGAGPYVLDGDMLRAERVTVTAGPVLDVVTFDPAR